MKHALLLAAALASSPTFSGGREGHGGKAKYGDQFYFIAGKLQASIDEKYGLGEVLQMGLSVRPTEEDLRADGNSVDMLSYIESIDRNSGDRTYYYPHKTLLAGNTRVTDMQINSWNGMECRAKHLLVLHELLVHLTLEKSQDYHLSSPMIEELSKDGKISCAGMPNGSTQANGKAPKENFEVDSIRVFTRCAKNDNLLGGVDDPLKRLIACRGELLIVELDTEYFRTRRTRVPVDLRMLSKGLQFLGTGRSSERDGMRTHRFEITGYSGKKVKDIFGKYSGSMFALEFMLGGYSEGGKNAAGLRIDNTMISGGGAGFAGALREYSLQPTGTIVDVEIKTNTPGNPVQSVNVTYDIESLYEVSL